MGKLLKRSQPWRFTHVAPDLRRVRKVDSMFDASWAAWLVPNSKNLER